jgi:hypothetical protein
MKNETRISVARRGNDVSFFEIKGGDIWEVVVEGTGIFDLRAGCEDEKVAAVWASVGPAAAARNGLRVDDFVVS